jgi:GTP cyclohydrolase II
MAIVTDSNLAHQNKKIKLDEDANDGIPTPEISSLDYVNLTTHSDAFGVDPVPISWGHPDPLVRGPVICTVRHNTQRNAIGAHSGSYCVYTGLAVAAGKLNPAYVPNLSLTSPVFNIGPHKSWSDPKKIASIDPFGHLTTDAYKKYIDKGFDIRPTIAVTKAHIDLPECREAIAAGRLKPDGKILLPSGQSICSKAAIEPVWYLPEIARRFKCTEAVLRQSIFMMTNGMYPELITRPDIKVFLPPIGGLTIYIWGDVDTIPDEDIELTCRVHDECNGSDVFGSDICTCRPYLTHAIEECIKTAQRGGCGIVIYFRKEGRSLGEVTKYLVYNTRKRQEGGDSAENYFNCTEQVAGVQDTRFQALMPDPLHFLGVTKIHNFISMSDMKYNAIVNTGIEIVNRIEIPKELVPEDAQVEITAKVFHGYNAGNAYKGIDENELKKTVGREYNYDKPVVEDYKPVVEEENVVSD